VRARGLSRRRWWLPLSLALIPLFGSCAFFLDFDDLQKNEGADASAGSGGVAGSLGGSGATGGGGTTSTGGSTTGGTGGTTSTGGAAGSDAGPATIPLTELAQKLADAVCTGLEACMGPAIELVTLGEDCRTVFGPLIADRYVAAIASSVASGAITYDPVLAAECVQNLLNDVQQTPPVCVDFNATVESCKSALGSLAAANEACSSVVECGDGLRCDLSAGCPGVCVPYGELSEPCPSEGACDPRDGLYCKQSSDDAGVQTGTCTAFTPVGTACTDRNECEPGAMCLGDQCRVLVDVFTARLGFSCGYTAGASLCEPGLSCEFSGFGFGAATCVTEKTPGAACQFSLPDACPANHYCSVNFLNGGGQCLALPTENQNCAGAPMQLAGFAPPCAAGLACVNGLCQTRRRLGEACSATEQCYSGVCVGSDGGSRCAPLACP
jgi:hypothetical protein